MRNFNAALEGFEIILGQFQKLGCAPAVAQGAVAVWRYVPGQYQSNGVVITSTFQ